MTFSVPNAFIVKEEKLASYEVMRVKIEIWASVDLPLKQTNNCNSH